MEENAIKIIDDTGQETKISREQALSILNRYAAIRASGKVRSLHRAIKRGRVSIFGIVIPSRPFNNRKNTCKRKGRNSRSVSLKRKRYYEGAKKARLRKADKESIQ